MSARDDLVEALEDFCTEVISSELVRWSLHLVLGSEVAAGLVPDWAQPRQVVAAAELAIFERGEPDLDLNRDEEGEDPDDLEDDDWEPEPPF